VTDITKRLRQANEEICDEAANEIEILRGTIILLSARAEKYASMNLANPQIQQAIIDLAESSESSEVAEACKLVIADHLEQGDTVIESPREVILTALECVETSQSYYEKKLTKASDEATESSGTK